MFSISKTGRAGTKSSTVFSAAFLLSILLNASAGTPSLHDNNRVRMSVFDNGVIGADDGADPAQGDVGVEFDGMNGLYEGGLVIAKSSDQVSGGLYTREFKALSPITPVAPSIEGFDQGFQSRFNDSEARRPIGVEVTQRSCSKSTDPDRDYVILDYRIKNVSGVHLDGILVGLIMDWDVGHKGNVGGFTPDRRLHYVYCRPDYGDPNHNWYGVAALTGAVSGGSVWEKYGLPAGADYDDSTLYARMTTIQTSSYSPGDKRAMVATGPYSILPGDSARCVFAVLGGKDWEELKANADTALARFITPTHWSVDLTVDGGAAGTAVRTFGCNENATNGYDPGSDEMSPPVPFSWHSSFRIGGFPNRLTTDMRAWGGTVIDWTLDVLNADGVTTTLRWNPAQLPANGNFRINGAGSVDMRSDRSLSFTGSRTLSIQFRSQESTVFAFDFPNPGWHLLSLPVLYGDSSIAGLFPEATGGRAYIWNPSRGAYDAVTKLENGKAYWLHFPRPLGMQGAGIPIPWVEAHFPSQGWYMIGGPKGTADFTHPDSRILTPAFTWDPVTQSYAAADYLTEGLGYWVAVAEECDLAVGTRSANLGKPSGPDENWDDFFQRHGAEPPGPPDMDVTGVEEAAVPDVFSLSRGYPNPFNPETRFLYGLPLQSDVRIAVYDSKGRVVHELRQVRQSAGIHTFTWSASGQPSGLYVVALTAGSFRQVRKCVLLR